MTEHAISPTEHHYNLLSALHDRLEDADVYRKYLEYAESDRSNAWADIWRRMLADAEQSIEFMRAEARRLSAG